MKSPAADQGRALRESLSAFQATLDSVADGILVIDRDHKITGYNQVFLDLLRLPKDFFDYRDYKAASAVVLSLLKQPERGLARLQDFDAHPALEGSDVLEFKDGRTYERYSRPQRLGSEIIGRVFSYRDITDRKRAEALLHQAAHRMKALIDASRGFADARLDLNEALQKTVKSVAEYFQNGCMVRLFAEDTTRLNTIAYHHVLPEVRSWMSQLLGQDQAVIDPGATTEMLRTGKPVLVTGKPEEMRSRIRPEFWSALERFPIHSWVIAPLRVAGKVIGTATLFRFRQPDTFSAEDMAWFQEVCERAAISINNAQLYKEAQHAIELREEFMSIASHELKTPLTPLRVELQLLSHLVQTGVVIAGPLGQRLKDVVANSDQQVLRLTQLVEDILDATRLRSGRLTLKKEEMDLGTLVSEKVEGLRAAFLAANCPVEMSALPVPKGRWDRRRIGQIITNLLNNAMKFGAGRPIQVKTFERGQRACFSVRDFGVGIDKEDQGRIFERLERIAPAKQFGGLGMGLFIAREIVEAHGGTISVVSTLANGALFTVELPFG